MVVFEVSSLLKAKRYSSVLVSVLAFRLHVEQGEGKELHLKGALALCLLRCRLPWLCGALPSPVPQFHSERRIFPHGLHSSLLRPLSLLGSVFVSLSPDVPSFSRCWI